MGGDFVAFCSVDRRLETGVFQVAQTHRIARSEHAQAVGVFFRLAEAESEAAEQLFAYVVKLLPSFERFVGYASVDENQRNVFAVDARKHGRPEVGFKPQNQIRPPMADEARGKNRIVYRNILMKGPFRQPFAHQFRRGNGAGCDHDVCFRIEVEQTVNQRQHG